MNLKEVGSWLDDYLWDIKWGFSIFRCRTDDIFNLFFRYPILFRDLCVKGNMPILLFEEIDTFMVIHASKSENCGLFKQYSIVPEEDGLWYPEHLSDFGCTENIKY